jgi:F-type H+-transporting ATPase subunit epsilon
MDDNEFRLEVITPERRVIGEEAEFLVVPAWSGEMGILKNHAPMVAALKIGVLRFTVNGQSRHAAISGGLLEITENKVIVLADTAEIGKQINLERARAAKERAESRLMDRLEEINILRAQLALDRALSRIKAYEAESGYSQH